MPTMNNNGRRLTGFRLTKSTVDALDALRDQINDTSPIKLSRADIVEILIRQAVAEKISKKVFSLT